MEQNDDNPTPLTADGIDARTITSRLFYMPHPSDYVDEVKEIDMTPCVIALDDDEVWVFSAFDGKWIAAVGYYHASRLSAVRAQLARLHLMAETCKTRLAEMEARVRAVELQAFQLED